MASLSPYAAGTTLEELFAPHLSAKAQVASSTDADFASVVGPRWSTWEVPRWSGAIKPATHKDLETTIKIASENGIPFIATNGGHGPKVGQGAFTGININLENFNSTSVDSTGSYLTVGGGASFGEMIAAAFNAGKEIQTGNAVCPGAVGATIGGGIGSMSGLQGMIVDALVSVEIVTAAGKTVTASKKKNPDLFWAIRGAGAYFGIIAKATYALHEQTNGGKMNTGTFFFPAASSQAVFELVSSYNGDNLPRPLAIQVILSYNRDLNAPSVQIQLAYFGTQQEVQPHFDAFAALNPVRTLFGTPTQLEFYQASVAAGLCATGRRTNSYTLGLKKANAGPLQAHLADMTAFWQANPSYVGISVFQIYSNKGNLETPASETVFPWRDVEAWWLFQNTYTDVGLEASVTALSEQQRDNIQAASGYSSPHVYVNYAQGDEGTAAWWSEANLPRLRELKQKWDPKNIFGNGVVI